VSGRPDRLTWLGHATAVIDLDGVRLVTDPAVTIRMGHLRRRAPAVRAPQGADAVLISHVHLDHLHGPSLRRVGAPIAVVPSGGARHLRRSGADVREVAEGDEVAVGAVRVRAVHAEHDGRRWPGRPATPALGYVVRGSRSVYFAGDTDAFPGMAALAAEALDLALMPVWGWGPRLGPGHLDPRSAAGALALLRPRRAVPIHWGTYATAWARRLPAAAVREPAEEFARHAAAVAPEVEVVVLRPGESTPLGG
jgi:L-ascorbate metabolism protein UlaG (beta-lactamase superfamily)